MASGNQVCKPTWADLPTAPIKKNTQITSRMSEGKYGASALITPKSMEWKVINVRLMPVNRNRSPTLLIRKALVAAFPAWARVYQKPISRYEHRPTPSQPRNSTSRFAEETSTSMKKVNNDK